MSTIKSNSLSSNKRRISYRLECSSTTKTFMAKAAEELHTTVKCLTDDAIGEFLPILKKRLEVAEKRTMEMKEWVGTPTSENRRVLSLEPDYKDVVISEVQLLNSLGISEAALWGYQQRGLPYWINDDGKKCYPQNDVRCWLSQNEPTTGLTGRLHHKSGEEQHG
jgi:hypothetical protein